MNLTFTTSKPNSVYINSNYVTIADSADLVSIILPTGASFAAPPSLSGSGLAYDNVSIPNRITGDPTGAYLNFIIPVSGLTSPGDFDNDYNDDFGTDFTGLGAFALEIVKPTFSTSTPDCKTVIVDTMVINNPAIGGGNITYYIQTAGVWVNVGTIAKGGSLAIDGCCLAGPGTFPIKAVFEGGGGDSAPLLQAEYTTTITFVACDYLIFTKETGCNKYKLKNSSANIDHTYTVFNAQDNTEIIGLVNIPLGKGNSSVFQLPEDGVYYVTVYNTDNSIKVNYPVVADCNVKSCLVQQFNNVYCKDCKCKDKRSGNNEEIFKILPLAYMFYSYVDKIYKLSSTFEMLDDTVLLDLQSMSSTLEALKKYCKSCGCQSPQHNDFMTKSNSPGDCGCKGGSI